MNNIEKINYINHQTLYDYSLFLPLVIYLLIAITIILALKQKENLEKRIINVVLIIILPVIGSLVFLWQLLFARLTRKR